MRGEKETKFANHERFNSFSASLPLFLGKDPGFCTRDSPSSLPWTGVGWGVSTHRSPQCGNHAGVVSWSLLPSPRKPESGLGLHRPSQGKNLSGSWKERGAGELGGCPSSCFSRREEKPGPCGRTKPVGDLCVACTSRGAAQGRPGFSKFWDVVPDIRSTVSDCSELPAPRHQLYMAEPDKAEGLPRSNNQGTFLQYARSQSAQLTP